MSDAAVDESAGDEPGPDGIVVIGEALMDVVVRGDEVAAHPGGSPMNVSFGLARLGVEVSFLTRLGDDAEGRAIVDHLAGAGVDVIRSTRSTRSSALATNASTSTATATIGADGSASYRFEVVWDVVPAPGLEAKIDHLHFGSIGAFLEPGASEVDALVARTGGRASISYDPNIRPQFLPDHIATVRRVDAQVAASDVVKASDEDLAWLYPGEPIGEVAARWLASGPSVVVVTAGEGGATAWCAAGQVSGAARRVTVADTIGAGDSFMSGLIAGLAAAGMLGAAGRNRLRAIPLSRLTALIADSLRCASITVSRPGANPPTVDELASARRADAG